MYWLFVWFFRTVLHIFFSDVEVIGRENIPLRGPVIFVGNHQNQFLDGMLLLVTCRRTVSFLVAAKSMQRHVIGWFAKRLRSIPVVRPQDEAKTGIGEISSEDGKHMVGKETKFLSQVQPGDSIFIQKYETARVAKVESDTSLYVDTSFASPLPAGTQFKFKIYPKTDHHTLYSAVWDTLLKGRCIGIFPEGGSHDRSEMLPLKAGVSIMALGAREKSESDIRIVPCGLTYFSGHRFRSRVVVEYGKPIVVRKDERLESYISGGSAEKRKACNELLDDVSAALRGVTINAPDYETLEALVYCRRLYQPDGIRLSVDKYLALTRRFASAYSKYKDHPQVQELFGNLKRYIAALRSLGLKDYQVSGVGADEEGRIDETQLFIMALGQVVYFLVLIILALPGTLLNLPITAVAKYMAEQKAKEALKASTVKIMGRDVIASYKVLIGLVLVPIVYSIYALAVLYYTGSNLAAIATFVLLPFFSYATMKVVQEGVVEWGWLKSVYTIKKSKKRLGSLRKMREQLKLEIRQLVELLGPETFPEFEKNRIVPQERLPKMKKKSLYEALAHRSGSYEKISRKRQPGGNTGMAIDDLPNS